jgi:RNA polymerase sigma-70 factor (ECF subfamily)
MPDMPEPRDVELLRQLAAGDEAAFVCFYRRHQSKLFGFALHTTGRPDAAADVVQETFMTLMRQAGKFDESRGAPAAFLYGIARNHVRRLQEKDARYVPLLEFGSSGNGHGTNGHGNGNGNGHHAVEPSVGANVRLESLAREEAVQQLREVVSKLPLHYREVVTLCDLQGKTYADAAALLECPVGTVRSRLNRAREILIEKMRLLAGMELPVRAVER